MWRMFLNGISWKYGKMFDNKGINEYTRLHGEENVTIKKKIACKSKIWFLQLTKILEYVQFFSLLLTHYLTLWLCEKKSASSLVQPLTLNSL